MTYTYLVEEMPACQGGDKRLRKGGQVPATQIAFSIYRHAAHKLKGVLEALNGETKPL